MHITYVILYIMRRLKIFVGSTGEYRIGIKFNDQHIPDSPYKLFISPAVGDAHKLEVAQFPTSGVQADYPAQFIVRKNGAVGQLDAKVSTKDNYIFLIYIYGYNI